MRIQETNNERTADEYLHDKQSVKDPDGKDVEKKNLIGVSDRKKLGHIPLVRAGHIH